MKAYIYTRFSPRPDAKDCDSCKKQDDRCVSFCDQKNWEHNIATTYYDENVSGIDIERPALNALINFLAQEKEKCTIVMDSPDRLARDLMVGLILRERIIRAGNWTRHEIAYVDGSPSGGSPEETFIANTMLALATLERDRVSYRTSRGLRKRQAAGEFFGKPPIGYMRPEGKGTKLVPCLQEREAVKTARNFNDLGWASFEIAHELQDIGSFRGGLWKAKTVRKMIKKVHKWESDPEAE
ncbi:hypothetical protein LCGC14_1823340 [marine sediment metagenome]|uniref:Resolvase/invertase-type recombinase catalytic domain-containing protein n=1 Tax=marine sediment metagenome TaxID=412755 RepID=A0A0F9H6F2_9ZZZZ